MAPWTREQLLSFLHYARHVFFLLSAALTVASLSGYEVTTALKVAYLLSAAVGAAHAELQHRDKKTP